MDQLLSISSELSVCEAMVEDILEKLDDLESPSIVSENLYLLLLLAGNCRSHIKLHVQKQQGGTKGYKSAKETFDVTFDQKEGDIKVEVESSDDELETGTKRKRRKRDCVVKKEDSFNSESLGLHYENTEYLENSDNGSDTDFEPYKSDKYSKESFSCDICSKIFAKKSKLEKHIETHGSKKAFSCQLCDKNFKHEQNLRLHFNKIHGENDNKKLFNCDKCGESFARIESLKKHMEVHSVEESPFHCKPCIRSFPDESKLDQHNKRQHREIWMKENKKNLLSCEQCEKTFMSSDHLMKHILKHAEKRKSNNVNSQ